MARGKKYRAEEIIQKLRQAEILISQGSTQEVVSKHAIFSCVPHFEFDLQTTSKSLAVSVDVRVSSLWLVVVKAFRILVDDRIVYSEGRW